MARKPSIKKEIVCKLCNNIFLDLPSSKKQFCSKAHAQQYKGVDKSWIDTRKATCIEKYGNEVAFKSPQVQQKYKDNLKEKYGVENPFLIDTVKDKAKNTINIRYGYNVASQNEQIKDKISQKLKGRIIDRENFINIKWDKLINYQKVSGMVPLFDKEYLENKVNHAFKNKFRFQCNKCSEITEVYLSNGYLPSCKCSDYKGYSLIEDELIVFLSQYISSNDMLLNRRDLLPDRLEIDVYIPKYKLAIEVNGIYWHSESMGKYKEYHLFKTKKCKENDIDLIHILDFEWIYKQPIIKSILLNKIGLVSNKIYARKCVIKEITDTKVLREFLDKNHIQGYTHSSINLGLYYKDDLVSVMTFANNRFKKNSNEYEMVRFCNLLNTNILGGASKLFKHFINNYNTDLKDIVSFSDRRFFTGELYKTLGFDFDKNISPSYIYWKNSKVLGRMSCQKHKLPKLLEVFDNNLTEYENMLANGWKRVWDCGNTRWVYKIKNPHLVIDGD
jgi:hypothetical protein